MLLTIRDPEFLNYLFDIDGTSSNSVSYETSKVKSYSDTDDTGFGANVYYFDKGVVVELTYPEDDPEYFIGIDIHDFGVRPVKHGDLHDLGITNEFGTYKTVAEVDEEEVVCDFSHVFGSSEDDCLAVHRWSLDDDMSYTVLEYNDTYVEFYQTTATQKGDVEVC